MKQGNLFFIVVDNSLLPLLFDKMLSREIFIRKQYKWHILLNCCFCGYLQVSYQSRTWTLHEWILASCCIAFMVITNNSTKEVIIAMKINKEVRRTFIQVSDHLTSVL